MEIVSGFPLVQIKKVDPSDRFQTFLARAVGVAVGRRSGGRLATTLVATKNVFFFPFFSPFSPLRPFLIEGVLG